MPGATAAETTLGWERKDREVSQDIVPLDVVEDDFQANMVLIAMASSFGMTCLPLCLFQGGRD